MGIEMLKKDILNEAYRNVPHEPGLNPHLMDFISERTIRYYWIRIKRFFTR